MNSYDVTDLVIVHIITGRNNTVLTSPMKKIDWFIYSVVFYIYFFVLA